MKKLICVSIIAVLAAGCSSQAERLAKCEAQGISRDACYIADENRQATINSAAEKQALENVSHAVQHAQSAKKAPVAFVKHFNDEGRRIEIKRSKDGFLYVDGVVAGIEENENGIITYYSGLYLITVYKTGKVAVMKNRVFLTYAK